MYLIVYIPAKPLINAFLFFLIGKLERERLVLKMARKVVVQKTGNY